MSRSPPDTAAAPPPRVEIALGRCVMTNPRRPVSRSITSVCSGSPSRSPAGNGAPRASDGGDRRWRGTGRRRRTRVRFPTAKAANAIRATRPDVSAGQFPLLIGRSARDGFERCAVGAGWLAHALSAKNLLHRSRDLLGLEGLDHDKIGAFAQGLLAGPRLRGEDDHRSVREVVPAASPRGTSRPVRRGIIMSRMTTSGRTLRAISRDSSPSSASANG